MPKRANLSVIIPVFNEMKLGLLPKILDFWKGKAEVIIVDGGSDDATLELVKSYPITLLELKNSNRAQRLNAGLKKATQDIIILQHPRSLLAPDALEQLHEFDSGEACWGGWTHSFDHSFYWGLKFTSWYSNFIRFDLFSIVYLDHCLFVSRRLLEKFDSTTLVPEVPIFEDTLLSQKLKRELRAKRLRALSSTSAVRFKNNGFWNQAMKNQWLKLGFYFKRDPQKMDKWYEKNLSLNSKY